LNEALPGSGLNELNEALPGSGCLGQGAWVRESYSGKFCKLCKRSNELIRRFFPKKIDFSKVTAEEIKRVEYLINSRPRKIFGGKTPLEVLFEKMGAAIDC